MRTTVQRHHGATSVERRNISKKDVSVKRRLLELLADITSWHLFVLDLFYLFDQFSSPIEKVSLFLPFFSYHHRRHQAAWKQRGMRFFCRRGGHLPYMYLNPIRNSCQRCYPPYDFGEAILSNTSRMFFSSALGKSACICALSSFC